MWFHLGVRRGERAFFKPSNRESNCGDAIAKHAMPLGLDWRRRQNRLGRTEVRASSVEAMRPRVDFGAPRERFAAYRRIGAAAGHVIENRNRARRFAGIGEACGTLEQTLCERRIDVYRGLDDAEFRRTIRVEKSVVGDAPLAVKVPSREAEIGRDDSRVVTLHVDAQQDRRVSRTVHRIQRTVDSRGNNSRRFVYRACGKGVARQRITAKPTRLTEVTQQVARRAVARSSRVRAGHGRRLRRRGDPAFPIQLAVAR